MELEARSLSVRTEVSVPIRWGGVVISEAYRIDLLVEDRVVIEVKASVVHHEVYQRQLVTYLKTADKRLGYVLNFGRATMVSGITRMVHDPDQTRPWKYDRIESGAIT